MGEFRMPSLGADMDVGTIIEWLVKPGDAVRRGQIVAVVDTAKAAIEIEAFEEGVVTEILIGTGVQVPVGTPLAMIGAAAAGAGEPGELAAGEMAAVAPEGGAAFAPRRPAAVDSGVPHVGIDQREPVFAAPGAPPPHPRATPPVRHLAHQLGVDLDAVPGTGPDGNITHDDVLRAAPAPSQPAPTPPGPAAAGAGGRPEGLVAAERLRVTPRARRIAAERGIDLTALAAPGASGAVSGADVQRAVEAQARAPVRPPAPAAGGDKKAAMRTAIANLMSRSNAEIPHYYVTQTVDLAAALAWLRTHNAALPVAKRVLPAALFLRATVLAAAAVPDLNGHWVDGALRTAERIDLGVAVATRGGGLVTPAIPDAGPLRIDDLMAALSDLVVRARRGNLRQAEMAGGSITVSSLGETGPDALYGVIFPPQVALVGIGGIVERPWAVGGMLTVRPTVTVTLAADHRASDGRTASAFLATFAHALQNPEEL
jgi:pyruvate dehydrogenase E2 component (dihydrolipoamide acetyltransferase)